MFRPRISPIMLSKKPQGAKSDLTLTINGKNFDCCREKLKSIVKNPDLNFDNETSLKLSIDNLPNEINHPNIQKLLNKQISFLSDELKIIADFLQIENLASSTDSEFNLDDIAKFSVDSGIDGFDNETIVRLLLNSVVADHENGEKYIDQMLEMAKKKENFEQTLKRILINSLKNAIENGNEVKQINEICWIFRILYENGIFCEKDLNLNLGNRLLPPQFQDLVDFTNRAQYRLFNAQIQILCANNFKLHKTYVLNGKNPDEVYLLLRNDDLDKFKNVQTIADYNEEHFMKSAYERCSFVNNDYMCYLDISAFFGSEKIFNFLAGEKQARLTSKTVHYAIAGGNKNIIDYCDKHELSFDGTLTDAIQFHRFDLFLWLVKEKHLPIDNCIDALITTCLQYSNFQVLSYLLKSNLEMNNNNLLEQACKWGCLPLVKLLMKYLYFPAVLNNGDINAFHLACQNGNPEIVEFLSHQKFINVNSKATTVMGNQGWDGLHFASFKGNYEAVQVLINNEEIDVNAKTSKNQTALHLACERSITETVKILLSKPGIDTLCKVMNSDMTALHISCQNGNCEIVKILLDLEPNLSLKQFINEPSQGNMTPLHLACLNGNSDVVKLLCQTEGVNINALDFENQTPIQIAVIHDHSTCVDVLVEQPNIDVNSVTKFSFPVDDEESSNSIGSPRSPRIENKEPIHNFSYPNIDISIIKQKRKSFSSVHLVNEDDEMPVVFFACMTNKIDIFYSLATCKFLDINKQQPNSGIALLHLCCQQGQTGFVKLLLLRNDIDVNIEAADKMTALHFAAAAGHSEIVKLLIAHKGINLNPQTENEKMTPLHIACSKGRGNVVEVLISNPDIEQNIKTGSGQTALQLACQNGFSDIFQILKRKASPLGGVFAKFSPDPKKAGFGSIIHTKAANGSSLRKGSLQFGPRIYK